MNIAQIIDENLLPPHGNRKGLSYGQLAVLLLTYVVSSVDHRLCCVEKWVNDHHQSLCAITGWNIGEKDATDDRCGDLLKTIGMSDEEIIPSMETSLSKHLIRAYELPTEKARSDTTSFSVYHQPSENQEDSSMIKFGYSKDKRPDLIQYRQMLGTLDPYGMPLVSATLAGNKTDESDYLPTWRKMKEIIGHPDFLYLGDSKASTHENRAKINEEGGIYCFPLVMTQQGRLSALPIYFRDEDKIRGLMFLLTIALRVFTLMEFVVRRQLQESQSSLAGLYDGNPKRSTNRPTAEKMLRGFCNITRYKHRDGSREISSLNPLQKEILNLMEVPESIYSSLGDDWD